MTELLTLDEALLIVDRLGFVVVDPGLFASAIARPGTTIFGADAYPDLLTKAAALLDSLVRNHALADGNKRTAFVLTATMLAANDVRLLVGEDDGEAFMLAAAQGQLPLAEITKWLAEHAHHDGLAR